MKIWKFQVEVGKIKNPSWGGKSYNIKENVRVKFQQF